MSRNCATVSKSFLGSQSGQGVPAVALADEPSLLRGGVEITLLAERAEAAVETVVDRAIAAGQRGQRAVGAPGTVHTWVPESGLTCLTVPSAIRTSGSLGVGSDTNPA